MRGEINFRSRAKQLRDFSGLRYGNITPTDIDGLIEYKDKAYIIMEAKFGDTVLPKGQELALERLCDDLQKTKATLLIVARHDQNVEKDIDFANCIVEKYRFKKEWTIIKTKTTRNWTVRSLIDKFLENK